MESHPAGSWSWVVLPRGSVPGTILFSIFIDDLAVGVGCTLGQFAGDTMLGTSIPTGRKALQRDLVILGSSLG